MPLYLTWISTSGINAPQCLGTVSKTLSPSLRLGYVVVPKAFSDAFAAAKRLADRHTSSLEQEALAVLIEAGSYERHVRRVRRRYAERRSALLVALSAILARHVRVVGSNAGLHVVAWLDQVPAEAEGEVIERALAMGLGLYPVSPLYAAYPAARPSVAGLVLGYASLDTQTIVQGVGLLRNVLQSSLLLSETLSPALAAR